MQRPRGDGQQPEIKMLNFTRRGQLRHLIHSCLVASFALPIVVQAQTDPEVEEVVVTGSYIRNSAFAQNSPVDTVTQEDLFESGAPSMGAYIRDPATPRIPMW